MRSNADDVFRRMMARAGAVDRELATAATRIGLQLNADAKDLLTRDIYDVPIPLKASSDRTLSPGAAIRRKTTKGKHGKWLRTGHLRRQESFRTSGPVIILTNNALYSIPRHTLGTAKGRPIRSPGVRSVQWQSTAVTNRREWILEQRRAAILRALRSP